MLLSSKNFDEARFFLSKIDTNSEFYKSRVELEKIFDSREKEASVLNYTIINRVLNLSYKASYDVRISKKLSKPDLRRISFDLQEKSSSAKKVFVVFYLPGMQLNAGGWATAHQGEDVRIMNFMLV
jgi:hypothetical protein